MLEIVDFDRSGGAVARGYGGRARRKIAVEHDGAVWMLKFPSRGRSPLAEYVGARVYASLGVPVEEVLLGRREGSLVVACRDLAEGGRRLVDFAAIKNTVPAGLLRGGNASSQEGELLSDALAVIDHAAVFEGMRDEVKERFWTMFVVDALVLNAERDNGGWGALVDDDGGAFLAPVLGNGGAFSHDAPAASFYVDDAGIRVNPAALLRKGDDPWMLCAAERIRRRVGAGGLDAVGSLVEELPAAALGIEVAPAVLKESLLMALRDSPRVLGW